MHQRDIDAGGPDLVSAVPKVLSEVPRLAGDVVVVGFDTEWAASDGRLLSVQLAVRVDGAVVSRVFYSTQHRLTPATLVKLVDQFLRSVGRLPARVRHKRKVVLVAHYAGVELGMFVDPIRDLRIQQIGKAHHAQLPAIVDGVDGETWSVRIVDLYAFYKTSLSAVGQMVGLPKIDLDPSTLETVLVASPLAFEAYATRDAEVALAAFEKLRSSALEEWQIDVLRVPTLAALASAIFRRHFLKRLPVPTKKLQFAHKRRSKAGWSHGVREEDCYDGPPERRLAACRAYWGGRVEAFVQGLVVEPVVELDVAAMYPSCALLQPLPHAGTRWQPVSGVDEVRELEGFGAFEFIFPADQKYPSLPVVSEGVPRLCFTRQGTTFCTFAEVRAALDLGGDVKVIGAWGFLAGEAEREHDLRRYMRHFLELKARSAKGTPEYETAKLLLNALIGKLGERRRSSNLLEYERLARSQFGVRGVGAAIARSSALRGHLQGPPGVGRLWIPEWAALVVGKARAVMATIIARGALLASTDAVIVPAGLDMDCAGLRELRTVGSDLEMKVEGDAVFIARSRLYAVLQDARNVRGCAKVIAQDHTWAVVRVARHGTPETEVQFAETVLACLKARKDVAPLRLKARLATAEAAVREDLDVNDEVVREGKTYYTWDSKRRLADRDVNLFSSSTTTTPYLSIGKIEGAEHQRLVHEGRAHRRPRPLPGRLLDAVLAGEEEGLGVKAIAGRTGVSLLTVARIVRKVREAKTERASPRTSTPDDASSGDGGRRGTQ